MKQTEQAIRDAAEKGGYRYRWWKANDLDHDQGYNALQMRGLTEHLYDPNFWKALGTARKWQDTGAWLFHWHRFIDHVAFGRPGELFRIAPITAREVCDLVVLASPANGRGVYRGDGVGLGAAQSYLAEPRSDCAIVSCNRSWPEGPGMTAFIGRREFIRLLGGAAVTWPLEARAQQQT